MAGNSTSSAPASSIDLPRAQPSPGNPCENPIQIPLHQTGSSKRRHRERRSGRGRIRRWRTWRKRPEPKNPTMKEREQHRSKKGSSTFVLPALFAFMETVARNMKSGNACGDAMLRLQVSGCGIRDRGTPRIVGRRHQGQLVLEVSRLKRPSRWSRFCCTVRAVRDDAEGGAGGFAGQSWDPGLEIEVPFEQRPVSADLSFIHDVNEYSALKTSTLYSWGELSPGNFFLRLGSLSLVTFTILGAPIAAASFNPSKDPLKFVLAAGTGTLLLVALVVLRIYLVLARDRLLGSYKVKPVIKLLKQTLVGTGALLVSAVSLFIFAAPVEDFLHSGFKSNDNNLNSATSQIKPNLRLALAKVLKEELLRLPIEVKDDDDLAAAAAEAADGRPVYCRDRFYRALAGGQYCKWDDLLN
ncbi:hypothetical protein B296_00011256 [Ensete ventricosum]|uniref:Uncharacterized protein n=1 Tax=Ensete ventricosum TaxID=4639 RepID=A0A427B8B1_ENSVE|nr:hypothetical protein B296_00011256 [Ensete ventricosum]